MLLKSIELKNFRQFVDERIEFATDTDKNVTLVIGENGTGKTTFAQAFFWCFYGETDFSDKTLLNRAQAEKMTPNESATVSVTLCLVHGSAQYEIKRTQEYKKTYGNKVVGANTVLNISIRTADGNTRYLKPLEVESEIKKILPKELANYFFFDGERIERMSKEITNGKKSTGFADAVAGLTGLKGSLAALSHLAPTKKNSVMGKFNDAYHGDSSGRVSRLTKEIADLQESTESIDSRLQQIDNELEISREKKSQLEQEIKQYAEGERLQNERESLQRQIANSRQLRAQFVKEMCTAFNGGLTSFVELSLVKRALEGLADSDFGDKDIPEMHSKTIQFLLKRGTCICGTHLDPGTIPYSKVYELLDYLPPQSIGVTVGQFYKDIKKQYTHEVDLYDHLAEKLALISAQDDAIRDFQEKVDLIAAKLDGDSVRDAVKKINTQIQGYAKTIQNLERERTTITLRKGSNTTEINRKENERAELLLLDKSNQMVEIYKMYTQRLYDELAAEYQEKENKIRERLNELINEIFLSIYNGGLSLEIDDKYTITVDVEDVEGIETSSAQSISVIFAFISSIIKLARENQNQGDGSYSEPYPLVMDAPLSAFDKRRIRAICTTIPSTAEQVIIFIKDTDGELAEEHLGNRVGARRHFEKIDELHTRLY